MSYRSKSRWSQSSEHLTCVFQASILDYLSSQVDTMVFASMLNVRIHTFVYSKPGQAACWAEVTVPTLTWPSCASTRASPPEAWPCTTVTTSHTTTCWPPWTRGWPWRAATTSGPEPWPPRPPCSAALLRRQFCLPTQSTLTSHSGALPLSPNKKEQLLQVKFQKPC